MESISEIEGQDNAAIIKVIGVGGGGCNALDHMIDKGLEGVTYIAVNTDILHLAKCKAEVKIQIGDKTSGGRGAGAKPEIGQKAAEENLNKIIPYIRDADIVFIAAGMGGGTGTGAAPVIAKAAMECGALTVAVVTKPFTFEGRQRWNIASLGINYLSNYVDSLIVIPNDALIENSDESTTMLEAFAMADDVLRQGVQNIADLISIHSIVNVDFADVRAILAGKGIAYMGIGSASGDGRVEEAIRNVLSSPLLETSICGARSVLLYISGGYNMCMNDVEKIAKTVQMEADPEADIIFGASVSEEIKEKIYVTIIATDFNSASDAAF